MKIQVLFKNMHKHKSPLIDNHSPVEGAAGMREKYNNKVGDSQLKVRIAIENFQNGDRNGAAATDVDHEQIDEFGSKSSQAT